jgi:solute carrier family 35 protein C2
VRPPATSPFRHSLPPTLPEFANSGAHTQYAGIALYTYHKYQKALHSLVPLDAHGNPLPQEDAKEVLQSATGLEFPPEEGFVDGDRGQYESPSEDEGRERGRRDEGGKVHMEGEGGASRRPHETQ